MMAMAKLPGAGDPMTFRVRPETCVAEVYPELAVESDGPLHMAWSERFDCVHLYALKISEVGQPFEAKT